MSILFFLSNFTCAKFLRTKILVNIYEFTASKVSFPIIWFIFHAYIACSISSESEEEQEPTPDTKQESDVKAKKNVNESVDDGDDRYILHVAVYTRYKHIYVKMYKYIPDIV